MNHSKRTRLLATFCLGGSIALTGCATAPPGGGNGNGNDNGSGNLKPGVLTGQVSSVDGAPIGGAKVALDNGQSASTDDNGFFSFANLDSGETRITSFTATGFATTTKALTVSDADDATPTCVFMMEAAETVTINTDEGSTQRSGDSAVTLEPGSLVSADGGAVTGDVELTATFIDPSTTGVMAFPGAFDTALTPTGETVTLESFGFAVYELTQDGESVNLAPGTTADIEYVLPDNAQDAYAIGDTIPLWEFDETTATWRESGTGTIAVASDGSGRLAWYATVDHFSAWNCDAPIEEKTCLTGRVVTDGEPIAGAEVAAVGVSYNGTSITRTGDDGTYCIEVKRGGTVRLEVRLNGSATPLVSQDVVAAATSADCSTGGCTEMDDLSVDLTGCVSGKVLNEDGSPAADVTVHLVPGETVTTDSNGDFCGAAASGGDVYVFAEGRPSVTASVSGDGTCAGGGCATANLQLTLPGEGDVVGSLLAQSTTTITDLTGETNSFNVTGTFFVADAETLAALGDGSGVLPGMETQVEEFGDCTLITQTFTLSGDSVPNADQIVDFGGLGALDPGDPGSAQSNGATVALLPGDPNVLDPPQPFLAGVFTPEESSEELTALGFGAGQDVTFSFPGGSDIGAFSASVDVPADIEVTQPDLADPDLTIDLSAALALIWVPGVSSDEIVVSVLASSSETVVDGGTVTITSTSAAVTCLFPDTGSASVPASALSNLPDSENATTVLTVIRQHTEEVDVPLNRTGETGVVRLIGGVSVTRALLSIPGLPDIGDLDLCSFIPCPDGQTCNPETFMCE